MEAANDIDGDGVNDLFVGDLALEAACTCSVERPVVLYTIDSPEPQENAKFGFFISVLGDVNGDGTTGEVIYPITDPRLPVASSPSPPDFVGAAPFFDVGDNQDEGRLFVLLSRSLLLQACPEIGASGFTDVAGNVHADAIACIAGLEIAQGGPLGFPEDQYGPTLAVRRDINAIASEDIVLRKGDRTYDPSSSVRRGQMASFIGRTVGFFVQSGVTAPPPA